MNQRDIEYFPMNLQRLNAEVLHHPKLLERLANHPANEYEILLSEIASYCEVVLDGIYGPEQQDQLAGILEKRLYNMRPKGSILLIS